LEQANRRLEARFGDLALLFEVSKVVSSSLDLERILSVFTERLATSMQIPRVAVTLICGDSESLTVISAHGFPEPERVLGLVFPRGEGIPWAALERQEPVVVQDTRDDPRVSYFLGRVREEGSLSAIPFRHKGSTIGVLLLGRPDGSGFCSDEVRLLTAISEQVAMAVANAQLHEEARTLAITDPLTGLYNRRFLANRLELEASRSLRFGQPLSMLMVDIDHFKEYNDANGHLFGDRALIKISQLLSSSLRQVDTVARYGGEEFVVLLPHTDAQGAFAVADKLRRMVAQAEFPHCIENAGEKLTISIGVATWAAEDGGKPEDALASADRALYRAKEEGRDRVVLTSCS
ncbi:MAG: sensor domain-containing diguanylate cyclase, partial [Deltaproteobacteria bacterium]|nr:sensor domain-containing diguanylate cyclase [Deltaproteobacteria bacterium]